MIPFGQFLLLFTYFLKKILGEKVVLEDEDDEERSVDFNEEEVLQRCHDFQKDYEKRKNQGGQPDCIAEKSTVCISPPVPKPRQFIGGRPISESAAKTQHSPRTTVSVQTSAIY